MPAVTIRLTGELRPGRGDGRRGAGSRVRPAAPLDPDRRQRLGTPGRRSTSNRRDCRSGRGGRAVRPRAADAPRRLPRPHPLCSARATNAVVPDRAGDARPSRTTRPLPRPPGFVLLRRTVTSTPSLSTAARRLVGPAEGAPRRSGASPHGGEPTALEGATPGSHSTPWPILRGLRGRCSGGCGAKISPVFPGAFRRMRLVIPRGPSPRSQLDSTNPFGSIARWRYRSTLAPARCGCVISTPAFSPRRWSSIGRLWSSRRIRDGGRPGSAQSCR